MDASSASPIVFEQRALALSIALSERHRGTALHCDRVVGLSLELAGHCGVEGTDLEVLRIAAGLHDIGKIGIPDHILLKPGKLSSDEWPIMQAHAEKGQHIVQALNTPHAERLAGIVRHHHEHYDGSGYPDGLAGAAIPWLARIISLVDSYDAMAGDRVYQKGRAHPEIMRVLGEVRGAQHDPGLFDAFAATIELSAFRARSS